MTAAEADAELNEEATLIFTILNLIQQRQEYEEGKARMKQQ